MKKLLFFITLAVAMTTVVSCEDEAKNPGDFSIKSTLDIGTVVTSINGDEYALTVARQIDTTYMYYYTESDTAVDENGDYVITSSGTYDITVDTVWFEGDITAVYTEIEPILLPSPADTFTIKLTTNARWNAPVPDAGGKVQWFYNYCIATDGTLIAGGGNGQLDFRVTRNRSTQRAVTAIQYIYTNDSTVLYMIPFNQSGEKD